MLWTLINFQTDYNKSILKRVSWFLLIMVFIVNLSSCASSNDITVDRGKNEEFVEVGIYDEEQESFKKLDVDLDQQIKVLEELDKLNKASNLYDSNNQYLGLDNAYSDGAYLIKVKDDKEYEIEIVDDNLASEDNRYWYNVRSRDKDIEGIYKTSFNLKDRIDRIILEQ
ncbi:TPA: hypothetical protein ACINN5_001200 [Streptococcus agalactiae]